MSRSKQSVQEEAFRDFQGLFISGELTPEQQQRVQATTNAMLEDRMNSGHFVDYFRAILAAPTTADNFRERFDRWHGEVEKWFARDEKISATDYVDFMRFSQGFFTNRRMHPDESGTNWYIVGGTESWELAETGAPHLVIEGADVIGRGRDSDSLYIAKTGGTLLPLENQWNGRGGKVDWQRVGLEPDVYADLISYLIETKRGLYEAKEAILHHPTYFGNRALKGQFVDKLIPGNAKSITSYPRFVSNDGYVDIEEVGENIRLSGNFQIQGTTIYATSLGDRKAQVEVVVTDRDGLTPRVRAKAERFAVKREERVVGEAVRTTVYFEGDSLFHPSSNMRINIPDRIISLNRGERGNDRNPFYHSKNRVFLDADYIDIYLDQDSMVIGKPTVSFANKDDVEFISESYFDVNEYRRFQNIADANPLAVMVATFNQKGNRFLEADLVAKAINPRFTVQNIQSLLYDLIAQGFVNYDSESEVIELKDKIFHYVKADRGNTDYDRLKIVSSTKDINATLNMKSGQTEILAVDQIEFSRRQRVAVQPTPNRVLMTGNRNLDFEGEIFAGFSTIQGKGFHFKYEPFAIVLDTVDYLTLYVPGEKRDERGNPIAESIASRIEGASGVLLIDAPNNKAGREDITMFPSLQSRDLSYVYYDKGDTLSSYQRDSFYFELQPFSFDHLDKFGAEDLRFEGKLVSADIFPEIEETLVLQEGDKSLGFATETPEAGLGTYGERGQYAGQLTLDNTGLQGQGHLTYLGAEVDSEDLLFEPKRMRGSADEFNLREERSDVLETPQVHGEAVKIDWKPYADSMYVRSADNEFEVYQEGDRTFDGTMILTSNGLRGDGRLEWSQAAMSSEDVSFGANSAHADTANVDIKSLESDSRLALRTENVIADLDFDVMEGTFKSNDIEGNTTLPYNQYQTTIDEFTWDMEGELISFQAEAGQKGRFTSIHPDQDSLVFEGDRAVYNLRNSLLDVDGVPFIISADAMIYPDSGHVTIAAEAAMAQLENARIVADTVNQYHVINRASVNITGRRTYTASGFYEYNVGPWEQEFELQEIVGQPIGKGRYSEKATATRAQGSIMPEDTFHIDHKTLYQGTINLDATSKNLQFEGFAKLEMEKLHRPSWFSVSFEGDKKDLAIAFDVPKDFEGNPLHTGVFLSKPRGQVYTSVMQVKDFRKDREILPITGYVNYDEEKDQFYFGDSTTVLADSPLGSVMVVDNKSGRVEGSGKLGLGSGLNYVSVTAYGDVKTELPPPPPDQPDTPEPDPAADDQPQNNLIMLADEPDEPAVDTAATTPPEPEFIDPKVSVNAMTGINLIVPPALMRVVVQDFKSSTFDAGAIPYRLEEDFYRRAILNLFPESKERQAALEGLALGYVDLPKKINAYTMLFSGLDLEWNAEYQSFISVEKKNGLVSLEGESVNKMIESRVEMRMPSAGDDRLYVYLKSPSDLYYFFGFRDGILNVTSNNTAFMAELEKMKEKDLIMKMDDGNTYEILPVDLSSANAFLRRIDNAKR